MTSMLSSRGINEVFHYAPLQYLLFIARSQALLSKNELRRVGYEDSHFRRTSRSQDELRGFSNYVHLTLNHLPPILKAKLARGFPHFEVRIPAQHLEQGTMHLCRFNIAKSRYLRRQGAPGSTESRANGRYHNDKQIPTAETEAECDDLLIANLGRNMIEILIPDRLSLPADTRLIFFSKADRDFADNLLRPLRIAWQLDVAQDFSYTSATRYVNAVTRFLEHAASDPGWFGDGLDFDRV